MIFREEEIEKKYYPISIKNEIYSIKDNEKDIDLIPNLHKKYFIKRNFLKFLIRIKYLLK